MDSFTTMRTLLHFRIGLVVLCLTICFRFGGAGSGSSSERDEMSHYLYDEDADPVQDYHGMYVVLVQTSEAAVTV